MRNKNTFKFIIVLLALFALACNNKKYIPWHTDPDKRCQKVYDKHLVVKNKIFFDKQPYKLGDAAELLYYDVESVVRLKPNLKVLGIRPLLWIYNRYDTIQYKVKMHCIDGKLTADTIEKKVYTRDTAYTFERSDGEWAEASKKRNKAKFRRWMMDKVGEAPTYYDTAAVARTTRSMTNILRQKGYIDATVRDTVFFKNHKAVCQYNIITGSPIIIDRDSVFFESKDSAILGILKQTADKSHLINDKKDVPLRLDKALFDLEKARITQAIRNHGYERFSLNYVNFEADTVNANDSIAKSPYYTEQHERRANIYVQVLPFTDTVTSHPIYTIGNVYILPDLVQLKPHQMRKVVYDTTYVLEGKKGRKTFVNSRSAIGEEDNLLQIILRKKAAKTTEKGKPVRNNRSNVILKNEFLSDAVPIHRGDLYHYDAMRKTVNQLSVMDVFKFPNVEYVPSTSGEKYELDCWVKMKPAKKQVFGWDLEANTYDNSQNTNVGAAISLNYRNRNVFKGAESFSINGSFGVGFNPKPDSIKVADYRQNGGLVPWLNLLDINAEAALHIPRFLLFHRYTRKLQNTHTNISLGYRYLQQASDLRISSFYAKYSYQFVYQGKRSQSHQFTFSPALLNFTLKPYLSDLFRERLAASNPALLQSLEEQIFIPSIDFSYTWSSPTKTNGSSWFFRFYNELAGNVWNLVDAIALPNKEMILLDGTSYSQYYKADIDARASIYLGRKHSLVSRIMLGAAVPYGNSDNVPFSRRFFLGGPNSMRAWRTRYLGPGRQSPVEGAAFQLGDIRLEMNMEYRFKFNSWIAGALFIDAGNVWVFKPKDDIDVNPDFPNKLPETGVFTKDFFKEIALGAGFGLRLDFSFFIIRVDLAMQIHNPAGYGLMSNGKQEYWNYNPIARGRNNWVLGVGYPF